jgi:hypothetical protein
MALALTIAVEGALNINRGLSEQHGLLDCFGGAEAVGALLFVWPRRDHGSCGSCTGAGGSPQRP